MLGCNLQALILYFYLYCIYNTYIKYTMTYRYIYIHIFSNDKMYKKRALLQQCETECSNLKVFFCLNYAFKCCTWKLQYLIRTTHWILTKLGHVDASYVHHAILTFSKLLPQGRHCKYKSELISQTFSYCFLHAFQQFWVSTKYTIQMEETRLII